MQQPKAAHGESPELRRDELLRRALANPPISSDDILKRSKESHQKWRLRPAPPRVAGEIAEHPALEAPMRPDDVNDDPAALAGPDLASAVRRFSTRFGALSDGVTAYQNVADAR